jgi:hypothetical protein
MWVKDVSVIGPFDYTCTGCNVTEHVFGWGAYRYVLLMLDPNTTPPTAPAFSSSGGAGSSPGNLPVVQIEKLRDATVNGTTGLFRISRTGSTGSTLNVSYSRSGSATYGTDYVTSPTGTTVTIPVSASYLDVTLTGYQSGCGKTATFTLSSSSSYVIDNWRKVASVNINCGQ